MVGADCRYSTFRNTDLRGATFVYANLTGANFENSRLGDNDIESIAVFTDSSGFKTETEKCLMLEVIFLHADLRNVSFAGLDLRTVEFHGAQLSGAKFKKAIISPEQTTTLLKCNAYIDDASTID